MDLQLADLKSMAERWLGDHNSKFRLTSLDESENRLVFESPESLSFNIICPNKDECWSVCSEDESVLMKLQDVMEFLDSKRNLTMDTVLTRITNSLSGLMGNPCRANTSGKDQAGGEAATVGTSEDNSDDEVLDVDSEAEEDQYNSIDVYYGEEDLDAASFTDDVKKSEQREENDVAMDNFFSAAEGANKVSVQRLIKDLKAVNKSGNKYGFEAQPRGSNLFKWDVKLINIPDDTALGKDLRKYAVKHNREPVIFMEMQFPGDYPYSPPFLRVLQPRFKFLTGHVTIGGSICLEMLTKSGWRPINDIESILVCVRSIILSDKNACLDPQHPHMPYSESEARDAFQRMVARYGWNK